MYFKQKLAYMALGCLFTIIGYILASLSGNPVNAQSQRDKSEPTIIDEIVCRHLWVVNDDGKRAVSIGAGSDGGYIIVYHANSRPAVSIGTFSNGGYISVYHANSKPVVDIVTTSNGGFMTVNHASGENAIVMGIDDTKKEFVKVLAKDQKGSIQLSANEYGGAMVIFNKGSQNVLQARVHDKGGGIITTQDKHGYRTGRLP